MLKSWIVLIGIFLLLLVGTANAALTTIGTATYNGSDYNLIWDDDNNGNSVVWFDYTNVDATWSSQRIWASNLDRLDYNIDSAYNVTWEGNWRLPIAGDNPVFGLNQTTSEMGDLFYNDLGLDSGITTAIDLNATNFDNLIAGHYWNSTISELNSKVAWIFQLSYGRLTSGYHTLYNQLFNGLGIRTGQVTYNPVPTPGTIMLLSVGLLALVGLRRKSHK